MLGLKLPTDPRWIDLAQKSIEDILTDHAYCELKAATTCISLIQLYSDHALLVDNLTPVVGEEWSHFRMVMDELKKRGSRLGRQRKDEYVNRLTCFLKKEGASDERLADKLLMSALIEARSCERFRILSEGIPDIPLREFYRKLMISEAGHYRMFLDLSKVYSTAEWVSSRWKEWLEYESNIMLELELRGDRMH